MEIRNFVIISHVDHGKSTLADRLLEYTGAIAKDKLKEQTLDTMDLERERGITIKLQPARLVYHGAILNLIDTPGHVDFNYEVSRSLQAVEGAILLVDASQGIQAQTLANFELARRVGLRIIPVVNKIDLPTARIKETEDEIRALIPNEPILHASGKTGEGVGAILDAIINRIPAPSLDPTAPLRALVFDSFFDPFRGVIAYVRVVDGELQRGSALEFLGTKAIGEVHEVGTLLLELRPTNSLGSGQIGYIVTGLKDVRQCRVGDTISLSPAPSGIAPLPGYKEPRPMVFAGLYVSDGQPAKLRAALEKLQLNDAAIHFEPHHSPAFGFGFTCGFLGMLHLEITKERLEREFGVEPIITTPTVEYKEETGDMQEPWVRLEVVIPPTAVGAMSELLQDARGLQKGIRYLGELLILDYEAPLAEIITNFHDRLKSQTKGYGSFSYEFLEYRSGDLVQLDVAIAGEDFDAFQQIVPRSKAERRAREIATRLKDLIPRQLFEVRIQVKIGGKILAAESVSPLRKDVTAKLYGGDVTRKRKLLEKQKKGKSRLKKFGRVEIPSDVFVKLLQ